MPDITMCPGGDCPKRNRCYRYKAEPNEHRQSYFSGLPIEIKDNGKYGDCEYYWYMRKGEDPYLDIDIMRKPGDGK